MTKAVAKREPHFTDRQRMFVEAYFACGMNATEAAIQAGYKGTRDIVRRTASQNLSKPHIRALIDARLAEAHLSGNEVLARIAFHARGSMENFIDADSGVIDMAKAREARDLGLIKRYRTKTIINSKDDTETLETEIEMYDAQAALRDLGKHLGLFQAETNINFNLTQLSDEELRALANGKKMIDATVVK